MSDQATLNDRIENKSTDSKSDNTNVALPDMESFVNGMKNAWNDIKDGKMPSGVTKDFGKPLIWGDSGGDDEVVAKRVERNGQSGDQQPALGEQQPGDKPADAKPAVPTGEVQPDAPTDAKPAVPTGEVQPGDKPADAKPADAGAEPKFEGDPKAKVDAGDDEDDKLTKTHKQPDGTYVNEYESGKVQHYNPRTGDITSVIPGESGPTVIESRGDGTVVQTDPDGAVTTTKDNIITRKEGNTTITVDTETGMVVTNENGQVTKTERMKDGYGTTLPNGDKRFDTDDNKTLIQHKDGSFDYITPEGKRHYTKNGEVEVTKVDNEGSVVTSYEDGSSVTVKQDHSVIIDDGQGHKVTKTPNGVLIDEFKDGRKVSTFQNGSKLTEKDGKRVFTDKDGNSRELDEDEEVRARY